MVGGLRIGVVASDGAGLDTGCAAVAAVDDDDRRRASADALFFAILVLCSSVSCSLVGGMGTAVVASDGARLGTGSSAPWYLAVNLHPYLKFEQPHQRPVQIQNHNIRMVARGISSVCCTHSRSMAAWIAHSLDKHLNGRGEEAWAL